MRPEGVSYLTQRDYRDPVNLNAPNKYLIYLDVWERHLNFVEQETEDGISIRETALDGADTTTRAQVVWQVRAKKIGEGEDDPCDKWQALIEPWRNDSAVLKLRGELSARAKAQEAAGTEDPCTIPPESRYRGNENQLYRVEVHRGGKAWNGTGDVPKDAATFKWSRENGSVVFPLRSLEGKPAVAVVEHLGADGRLGLLVGDWVELVDDWIELGNSAEDNPTAPTQPGLLLQATAIDPIDLKVTLSLPTDDSPSISGYTEEEAKTKHALLRRWDQQAGRPASKMKASAGALAIVEKTLSGGKEVDNWLALEDGIQVQFERGGHYRTGDYWLIPARTATGDVEWPGTVRNPKAMPPHGVDHHCAPLAIVTVTGTKAEVTGRCRQLLGITPLHWSHSPNRSHRPTSERPVWISRRGDPGKERDP